MVVEEERSSADNQDSSSANQHLRNLPWRWLVAGWLPPAMKWRKKLLIHNNNLKLKLIQFQIPTLRFSFSRQWIKLNNTNSNYVIQIQFFNAVIQV